MTVTQAGTGLSGPYLGRAASVTSTPDLRTGTYSIACRVKWGISGTSTDMLLLGLSVGANGRGFYFQRKSGDPATQVICYRFDGTSTFNVANMTGAYGSTTAWVHMGATYDGTTIRTYVNGVASGTIPSTTTLIAAGAATVIMVGGQITAEVADVVMHRRALTAAEMNQIAIARFPMNRRSDMVGWWPMFDPTSLTQAGLDMSTIGNHLTLQASGANNPAAAHGSVPIAFQGQRSRMIYVAPIVNNATAAGLTNCTGAATGGVSAPAAGLTNCTGAANPTASAPASGLTQTTGAAAPTYGAPATGTTQTTGAATGGVSGRAAGLTNTTGLATGSPSGSAVGLTQCTGSSSWTAFCQATGLSQTTGAAANNLSTHADGLTQTTGAASGSTNGAFSGTCAGLTQCTGVATATISCTAAGLTSCTGAAGPTVGATATGTTQTTGAASASVGATAAGLTQTTGAASGSSSGGGGGSGAAGQDQTPDRRFWEALGARRKLRG